MIYNINEPNEFLKDKKFFKYCGFHLKRSNIKILPDLVQDFYLLIGIIGFGKIDDSISFKYLYYGRILNEEAFNRLLEIDIVYGLREYFQCINEFYEKYNSPTAELLLELIEDEQIREEIFALDDKYVNLLSSINLKEEVFLYYNNNKYDLEFEVNYDSSASMPGNLSFSKTKGKYLLNTYKSICNKGFFKKQLKLAEDLIKNGDVQPGVVVSLSPLKIFAYSDEFVGGVMLKYPLEFVSHFGLELNQRVIFINGYWPKNVFSYRYDLLLGDDPTLIWRDFIPLLAVLFSDELEKINSYLDKIDEDTWSNVNVSVEKYIEKFNDYAREGMEFFIEEK